MFDKIEMDLYTYINYVYIKYIYIRTLVHIGEWKMFGQILGILDPLANILKGIAKVILELLIPPIAEHIIAPALEAIIKILVTGLSLFFYTLSVFLLGLIDFVEALFRALGGLPAKPGAQYSATITFGGETEGDLVLQLIRNQQVQQAFLSMCIVGLFLLLVTSVFQIIKTEYTTEGAKNAKGPILNKAFRSLCNLMLLPILCVFGVIFANQLLNLLDKATSSSGKNPTISGCMFVAGASDAHRYKDEEALIASGDNNTIMNFIDDVLVQAILEAFDIEDAVDPGEGYQYSNIAEIEDNFTCQESGFKFNSLVDVTKYYRIDRINYIVVILGAIMTLKALFFACFGMILRLYKCAMLFIISPVVIGMTPINEGGLGKWRGQFIGQVLSAYGVIISVNLFLVLVRVMLHVEVSFQGTFVLSNAMMTGLLKALLVIAGASLIEKFAKDIGAFFGAEDAISGGKDLAKSIGDTAMSGVKVVGAAGALAMGGAGLAMKGIKSAGGLAGKIAKGGAGAVGAIKGGGLKGLGDFALHGADGKGGLKGLGNTLWTGQKDGEGDGGIAGIFKTGAGVIMSGAGGFVDAYGSLAGAASGVAQRQRAEKTKSLVKQRNEATARKKEFKAEYERESKRGDHEAASIAKKNMEMAELEEKSLVDQLGDVTKSQRKSKKYSERLTSDNKAYHKTADGLKSSGYKDAVKDARESVARGKKYGFGLAQESLGQIMNSLPGVKWVQGVDKMAFDGMSKGDEGAKAAAAAIKKNREKRVEDRWENNPISSSASNVLIAGGAATIMGKVADDIDNSIQNAVKDIKQAIGDYRQRLQVYGGKESQEGKAVIERFVDKVNGMGGSLDMATATSMLELDSKVEIDAQALGFTSDMGKMVKAAVAEGMAKNKGKGPDEIINAIKDLLEKELGTKGNLNMMVLIEKLVKEHLQ